MTERDDLALQGNIAGGGNGFNANKVNKPVEGIRTDSMRRETKMTERDDLYANVPLHRDRLKEHHDQFRVMSDDDWIRRSNSQSPVSCGTCGGLETDWMHGPYVSSDLSRRHPFNPS